MDRRTQWPEVIVRRRTDDALAQLSRYYARTAGAVPMFTGSRFEAISGMQDDPFRLTPSDLVAVSTLSVEIKGSAAIRLLETDASEIAELLAGIEPDIDIVDVDPAVLANDSPADKLWTVIKRSKGIGPTRISKLMAAKRPRLIPIWDTFVGQATGMGTAGYWRAFQEVLLADDRAIWTWLESLRRQSPRLPGNVSTLRVLDVLLWMSVYEQGQPRDRNSATPH